MRRLLPLALALVLSACGTRPPVDADPALWVVRDGDTKIYLFGTVHMLRPGLSWFDEGVRRAFDESGELLLELVLPPPGEMRALVTELGDPPGNPPIASRIGAAETQRLHAALKELGMAPAMLDRADPWFAATTLSSLPLRRLGYDESDGAEAVLRAAAERAGKQVRGLETARQQLGYFDGLSAGAQRRLLAETLTDLPTLGATIDRVIGAWSTGDADRLAHLLNEDLADSPELAEALLVRRNRAWAQWIAQRMRQPGTVFVAVGAGHLAGERSVQAELTRRGLRVERVIY